MNKKTLSLTILTAAIWTILGFSFALAQTSSAANLCDIFKGIKDTIVPIGGTLVIVGWLIAGILFLTAAGGPRMEIAKKALWAAIIGTILVIIAVTAYAFVNGIIGNVGRGQACYLFLIGLV